jgi:hypothetical protein
MSHYGVKIGCYKYQNDSNDNGQIVHIKSLTKYFVEYDIYNYYDNQYSLPHLQSILLKCLIASYKKKVKQLSGLPSFGASLEASTNNQYELNDNHFIGANTHVEWKQKNNIVVEEEQPVVEDDGTAENDLDDLEAFEYKKEVERSCPKRHITEWRGGTGYSYTLDKKWVKEVLDFLDTTYLNNSLGDNRQKARELLTNNDRLYDRDIVLIERFVEFLKTDFMTTNVFLAPH